MTEMKRRDTILAIELLLVARACSSGTSVNNATGSASTVTLDSIATTAAPITAPPSAPTSSSRATSVTSTPTAPTSTDVLPVATPTTPAGARTTEACRAVDDLHSTNAATVSVRRDDCGEGVRQVQTQLNYKLGISLNTDGRFGAGTQQAVRNFQPSVGIAVNGMVGTSTWIALNDDGT